MEYNVKNKPVDDVADTLDASYFDISKIANRVINKKYEVMDSKHWTARYKKIAENEKRFQRYIDRMADFAFQVFLGSVPEFCLGLSFDNCKSTGDWVVSDYKGFCAKYLFMHITGFTDAINALNIPTDLFTSPHQLPFVTIKNEDKRHELFDFFMKCPVQFGEKQIYYRDLFDKEFRVVCQHNLKRQLMLDENLVEDNFLRTVPKEPELSEPEQAVVQAVTCELLNRLLFDILRLFSQKSAINKAVAHKTTQRIKDERDALQKKLNSVEKQVAEREKELRKKEEQIKSLSAKISSKNSLNIEQIVSEKTEDIAYENKSLLRQNRKLQVYYNDLLRKYEKLKENMPESEVEDEEDVAEEMKEVDMNARYLFVCYDDVNCKKIIKEAFENAEFTDKVQNFSKTQYDMVVTLTDCIDHATYLQIKKQCKTHSIKFAHCPHSNIEMIKTVIWNVLNS